MICFECGIYGHTSNSCPNKKTNKNIKDDALRNLGMEATNGDEMAPTMETEFTGAKFGPWMVVFRKGRLREIRKEIPLRHQAEIFMESGMKVRNSGFLPMILWICSGLRCSIF